MVVARKAGHGCRYTYVGERETKIFLSVELFYQEKRHCKIMHYPCTSMGTKKVCNNIPK